MISKDFINRGTMPLVGRSSELGLILEGFADLLEGNPRALWITGPAGIGKSRLLDELKDRVRRHTARSLVVHAKWYEGEGIEFGPLANALDVLKPVVAAPLAARIFREGSVIGPEAAVEAVQVASRRYPVVLIFDDLHYLDSSTELSQFVAALEEIPALLIVTTRPSEVAPLRSFRSELARSHSPREMEIGPLDGDGIAEAARELFGADPPPEMLGQIADLSGGVPLALREVFRELIGSEHVVPDGESWLWKSERLDDDELRRIAEGVHGFAGRLASLPVEERRLLGLAAFLGEQFNRDLLRRLAEGIGGWDDHVFERLILGGHIAVTTPSVRFGSRDSSDVRGAYAFTHTLLWKAAQTLDDELPERSELSAATLAALVEGSGEIYSTQPLEGAAVDALEDESLHDLLLWLERVGRRLPSIYAESFVALARGPIDSLRAADLADALDGAALDAWLALLTVYGERLYQIGDAESLDALCDEIARLLDRFDEPASTTDERVLRLEAAVVLWQNSLLQGDSGPARTWLDPMLETLPAPTEQTDRELRGAAEAIRLRAAYAFSNGEFAEAFDLAAPYLSELDRMRPEALNALMKVLLYALLARDRIDEGRAMVEAGLRLRSESDLFTTYEFLLHAANFAFKVKDIGRLEDHALELRRLVDRYPVYRGLSTNFWHLPYVHAWRADEEGLMRLEKSFATTTPPARTIAVQTQLARYRFAECWNLLGRPDRARIMAEQVDRDELNVHQLRYLDRELRRATIDGWIERSLESEGRAEPVDATVENPTDSTDRLHGMMLAAIGPEGDPSELVERYAEECRDEGENQEHLRSARLLMTLGELADGGKRALNDAAYRALSLGLEESVRMNAPDLAHHWIDLFGDLLPRTRTTRFRKEIGVDRKVPDEGDVTPSAEEEASQVEAGGVLRTFGALRMEGTDDDSGTKIESKTRLLVAALVTSRLGESRSTGDLTRDRMADLLWPEMTIDRAVNNLHATTSYARRFLGGSETIRQVDGVYQLSDEVRIDALDFRECIEKANRLYDEGVYFGAAVAYRSAVEYAEGDFLEGMYAEWIDAMREMLRSELATALERLIALEVDRDNHQAIPRLAERLLVLDDLHDGAYEALIRSAALRGARREAFGYYKRYETALDEYGAGPTRKISELIEKVRSGEEIVA